MNVYQKSLAVLSEIFFADTEEKNATFRSLYLCLNSPFSFLFIFHYAKVTPLDVRYCNV
jgi:hypothetical protein